MAAASQGLPMTAKRDPEQLQRDIAELQELGRRRAPPWPVCVSECCVRRRLLFPVCAPLRLDLTVDDERFLRYRGGMALTLIRKHFLVYGLSIAAAEEFLTQGLLKNTYALWVFTLIPFAVFLILASCLREFLHGRVRGWVAPLLYYISMGTVGLAVEWFIIGLNPWSDKTSPLLLIALFHTGMFSFWGTVALGPHILLDDRHATAIVRRVFASTLVSLLVCSYVLALTAWLSRASDAVQFLATVGPVVLTFLSMNGIYAWYFCCCRRPANDPQRL